MAAAVAQRALIVGLDVGDGGLIRTWASAGRLPVLASLIERGQWQWLDTTAEALHVSGWPSLYTGSMPGDHGVYYTFQPTPGRQGWSKFGGNQYGRPTFWNLLSRSGVRCTVLDAPYTHPEPGSTATQIFEWGTWAHYWKPMSTPSSLWRRLRRACGRYPLGIEAHDVGMEALDRSDLSPRLAAAARAKTEAALWLMGERAWDLFFVVYGESHPGAHYCWDPAAGGGPGAVQPTMRAVYEEIDRGVGALLDRAGAGASVFVVSGDGVGPNHAGWHLLPEVLRRLGYLVEPIASPQATEREDGGAAARSLDPIRRLRDALPKDLRKALARRLPDAVRHRLAQRVDTAGIDWSKTRAFCLPTDLEGCVRINVRGREAQGVVEGGEQYRRVCDDIAAALEALIDPRTGRRAVRAVLRTDDVFPGARRDYLPDLIVLWNAEGPLTRLASAAIGTVTGDSPDRRPGTHAPPGFLLRSEPDAMAGDHESSAHVCDLAPEILRRFGVAAPATSWPSFDRHGS